MLAILYKQTIILLLEIVDILINEKMVFWSLWSSQLLLVFPLGADSKSSLGADSYVISIYLPIV